MIIEIKDERYKHIKCVAMFDGSMCISSDNTYVKLYYPDPPKHFPPHKVCCLHACFGVKGVSSMMLRELIGMPCTLQIYAGGELDMTMQCYFIKFEKELSGFNEGGYRLVFQRK